VFLGEADKCSSRGGACPVWGLDLIELILNSVSRGSNAVGGWGASIGAMAEQR
jgi:hypothetical protein